MDNRKEMSRTKRFRNKIRICKNFESGFKLSIEENGIVEIRLTIKRKYLHYDSRLLHRDRND